MQRILHIDEKIDTFSSMDKCVDIVSKIVSSYTNIMNSYTFVFISLLNARLIIPPVASGCQNSCSLVDSFKSNLCFFSSLTISIK